MPFTTQTYIRRAERDDLDTVVRWMESPDFQYFLYGDPARSPRQVRDKIVAMLGRAAGVDQLSMGMSGDFETAIAMGATHVRVGSALFGARPRPAADAMPS